MIRLLFALLIVLMLTPVRARAQPTLTTQGDVALFQGTRDWVDCYSYNCPTPRSSSDFDEVLFNFGAETEWNGDRFDLDGTGFFSGYWSPPDECRYGIVICPPGFLYDFMTVDCEDPNVGTSVHHFIWDRRCADMNGDGFVDGLDSDMFNNWFEEGKWGADLNHDRFVDGLDSDLFNLRFEGSGCE